MDSAFEFTVNGLNMEFAFRLMTDGHNIPGGLFVDILTEKNVNSYTNTFVSQRTA